VGHSLPTPALIDYISVPEIELIVPLSFGDLVQHRCYSLHVFREKEKAAWAAKEIAIVLLWCL